MFVLVGAGHTQTGVVVYPLVIMVVAVVVEGAAVLATLVTRAMLATREAQQRTLTRQ
jgi:hypothetical protein